MKDGPTPLVGLNQEMLRMADFTDYFWNSGTRFWLEWRGPALARELSKSTGLKIWLQVGPTMRPNYILKIAALLADQVIIGHTGPLPGHHMGLIFPWRVDESREIPPPRNQHTQPVVYNMFMDAIRRPLPPNSKYFLFGSPRRAIELGMLTYFPASIIYSPIQDEAWPSPSEIIAREGEIPINLPAMGVIHEEGFDEEKHKKELREKLGEEHFLEGGFVEYDKLPPQNLWEYIGQATKWEMVFSSLIANGGILAEGSDTPKVLKIPEAIFTFDLEFLYDVGWNLIYKIREEEKGSLLKFRQRVLRVCQATSQAIGSEHAIRQLQEEIDEEMEEVNKGHRKLKRYLTQKGIAHAFGVISIEIAAFFGLPPLAAAIAGAFGAAGIGLHLKVDIEKEMELWRKQMHHEKPMYFLWRLKHKK